MTGNDKELIGGIYFWVKDGKFYQQVDGLDPMEVTEDVWSTNRAKVSEPAAGDKTFEDFWNENK